MPAIPKRANFRDLAWVASLWEPAELVAALPLAEAPELAAPLLADPEELEARLLAQFAFGNVQAIVEVTVLVLILMLVELATVLVAVAVPTLDVMNPAEN